MDIFDPFSKVFREISLADELGSGMRNTYKYTKLYSGGTPEFIEGNVFRAVIPLTSVLVGKVGPSLTKLISDQVSDQVSNQVSDQVSDQVDVHMNNKEQNKDIFQKIFVPLIAKRRAYNDAI